MNLGGWLLLEREHTIFEVGIEFFGSEWLTSFFWGNSMDYTVTV